MKYLLTQRKVGNNESGQSLVEVVVALGMVILLVTGLIAGTTTSLRSSQNARSRTYATKLTQEGLEVARQERDTSWSSFRGRNGIFCLLADNALPASPVASETSCSAIIASGIPYTRTVTFTWQAGAVAPAYPPDRMQILSRVVWGAGSDARDIELRSYLTQWR